MLEINLSGTKRTETGKRASRLMRKEGLIPCNLYGEKRGENGLPEAVAFSIPFTELRKAIYTPNIYIINLDIDGEKHLAITKEMQFHPVTDAGVRLGGRMSLSIRQINVTAPYKQIPEKLDIDVTALEIGKSIKVGDLSFPGIELATSPEVIVCSVKMTRAAMSAAAAEEAAQ